VDNKGADVYLLGRRIEGQIEKRCLILGIRKMCKGARSGVGNCFCNKVIHNLIHRVNRVQIVIHRGGGGCGYPVEISPPGVKYSPYMYNTPTQKIYAKVKCPILYTYF
jgi:hypothetical protein